MYTIFVNNKPIILSHKPEIGLSLEIYAFNEIRFEEILHKLRFSNTEGICVYHTDLEKLFINFKKEFKVVLAAGGLVIRDKKEVLFILRNNRWDLPKGKKEIGESNEETALREVEEECGIGQLSIETSLQTTYHIFYENNTNKLKQTHWFLMSTADNTTPKPQEEEGIDLATFVPIVSIPNLFPKMYANIQLLINKNIAELKQ